MKEFQKLLQNQTKHASVQIFHATQVQNVTTDDLAGKNPKLPKLQSQYKEFVFRDKMLNGLRPERVDHIIEVDNFFELYQLSPAELATAKENRRVVRD